MYLGFMHRAAAGFLVLLNVGLFGGPAMGQAEGVVWTDKIEVASGDANKGPWRQNESAFYYVDDPSPAISALGDIGIVWVDQTQHDVFFQVFAADGAVRFAEPVNVSRSPDVFSWLPRLAFASDDANEVYILWQEIVFSGGSHGGEIFFARSGDGGATFDDPLNLTNSLAGEGKGRLTERRWNNGSLDLALGPQGDLYVTWTEYEGNLWFARSTDRGRTFSDPLLIAGIDDGGPARGPSLAIAPGGTIVLAWAVGEDDAADIHVTSSDDRGMTFEAPRIALETEGHSDAPKIVMDGEGALHLVFAESPDGMFGRYHLLYTRSQDGGLSFERPREIAGINDEQVESVGFPALSVDNDNTVYLIWERYPNQGSRPQGLGFTMSWDGGGTFAAPSIIPGSADPSLGVNGSLQGLLMRKLAVSDGQIVVANSTFKADEASHIWLFRGSAE